MRNSDQVRLVVFDCDGTLVDSQHNICAAMRASFADSGINAPDDAAIRRIVGLSLAEAVNTLAPTVSSEESISLQEGYKSNFMHLRQQPEYSEPLYPGIREVLIELENEGFVLAVATGKTQRGLRATLEHHGLRSTFMSLQTADDAPGKPDPGMLEQAMADTGATPYSTVMLGDTIFDMTMAQNAGVAGVGVSWGYHGIDELRQSGAREIIDRCEQLLTVAQRLTGS
jgi:phosphoglycolate phosphatase